MSVSMGEDVGEDYMDMGMDLTGCESAEVEQDGLAVAEEIDA